jgi:hypothetical protein
MCWAMANERSTSNTVPIISNSVVPSYSEVYIYTGDSLLALFFPFTTRKALLDT